MIRSRLVFATLLVLVLLQPLPIGTWLKMRLHYLICVWCSRYLKHLNFLHAAAHGLDEHVSLPAAHGLSAEAKQRIVQRLQTG